ncbi:MAG TPA: class I SAM-dependent methyltransferase [Methylomirabilota bacterium]|jgi:2-polyprenyl-6-hydroxyphenyl methylase/3-demethylubiquinone-9 3-methyltransferase|nr:class I SAM-dependent methyltransferase [Methylomirabilota bacterium]
MRREAIARVIAAYDDPIIRAYSWGRFLILRQRFLDEIGQYLPAEGTILDIGCGFGLFSLYYAQLIPAASFRGLDLNPRRVALATEVARRLGLANTAYAVGDARTYRADAEYAAAYMLDIVHHVPPETVEPLLSELHKAIRPGGCLLVKDVDTQPAYKRWFTHALDLLMSPGGVIHYWPAGELAALLQRIGFRVYRHLMVDVLPYPHVLFVCHRD